MSASIDYPIGFDHPRMLALGEAVAELSAVEGLVLLAVELFGQYGRADRTLSDVTLEPGPVSEEEPLDPAEVAEALGITAGAAASHLRALADRGLVARAYRLVTPAGGGAPRARVGYVPEPGPIAGQSEAAEALGLSELSEVDEEGEG